MRGHKGFKDRGKVVESVSCRNWWAKESGLIGRVKLERQMVLVREVADSNDKVYGMTMEELLK